MAATSPKKGKRGKKPPRAPEPENAWDLHPDETGPAYAAFREYLLMGGDRSTSKVGRSLGKSKAMIERWSSRHRWVARAQAFDAEAGKRADEAAIDELEQRARDTAKEARTAFEAMLAPSKELVRRLKEDPELLSTLPVDELVRLSATTARAIPRVVMVERLSSGQSTTNVGGHRGGPVELEDKGRAAAERRASEMPNEALDAFLLGAETQKKVAAKRKRKAKAA